MARIYSESFDEKFIFQYPVHDSPTIVELRNMAATGFDITKDEFNKSLDIIGYAHSLFIHNGDNTPSSNDPLTILKEAQAGQSFRCVEYSTLAAGLLWAYGIPARTVGLKTSDVETREYGAGHVVIEFWNATHDKWIMSDVQAGLFAEHDGDPLSTYELQQISDRRGSVAYRPVPESQFRADAQYGDTPSYSDWIHQYLYFIDTPVSLTLGNENKPDQRIAMLVPPGVQPPKMFQGMFAMNAVYTHNPLDFYQNPNGNIVA